MSHLNGFAHDHAGKSASKMLDMLRAWIAAGRGPAVRFVAGSVYGLATRKVSVGKLAEQIAAKHAAR